MILVGTRDPSARATFAEGVLASVAPGGGLYIPAELDAWDDIDHLLQRPFLPRSIEILTRLLGDEFAAADIETAARAALDFPVPVRRVDERLYVLELFHGPTLAFKDFGARFLAQALIMIGRRSGAAPERTILTATSGDTGAAVAHAFWGRPGFRVLVLYPHGRVSPIQERQFATLGGNVRALAVDGTFDDCQTLVKACLADSTLSAAHGLTSANSINVARLLAQVLYYFEAGHALRGFGEADPPVISVPSGNFGNLCAGLLAWRLGLPVTAFAVATNVNRTVPDYLESGAYRPRPSIATLSNAMDVGAPNNWERIEVLFGRDLAQLRRTLRWGSRTDEETLAHVRDLHARGYVADPHSAIAYGVLRDALRAGETGVFLATAHPAKFAGALERTLGRHLPLPPALAEAADRPLVADVIPNELAAVRAVLEGN